MFSSTSRYAKLPIAEQEMVTRNGASRTVRYVRRRFIGSFGSQPQQHVVNDGDRLDVIANESFGDPTLFWRICDANTPLNPFMLLARAGDTILIPTQFTTNE